MKSDFIIALTQLAAERNLPREIVLSAIEAALASAYKRDSIAAGQNISVKLDPGSGDVSVFVVKTVVEDVEDSQFEISLGDAKKIQRDAQVDDVVRTESLPHSAGRIAAQTAKQVVMQRLREAERDLVFKEFSDKEGEVFTVTVQKIEPRQVTVEMGRAEAVLPHSEQPMYERYRVGQKVKVLLQSIRQSNEGPELIVSRADQLLLRRLFEMEVPEIYSGAVEIVDIAREAGSRSKVAVFAKQEGVDAVGSCVGLRGIRIQNIVNELQGEKIDVIQWSRDLSVYISHALSPAQPLRVDLNEAEQAAVIVVPDRQLSLAIGREGQNARLAAKLTNWKIDIKSSTEIEIERMRIQIEGTVAERETVEAEPTEAVAVAPEDAGTEEAAERAAAIAAEEAAIMAELEAEAAVQTEEVEEAAGGLSAEELLALESLDQIDEEIEEIIVEEVEEDVIDDDIWKVPEPIGGGPTIRFAEDILGAPQARRGGGRRRGGGPRRGNANRGPRRPGGAGGPGAPGASAGGGDFPG